MLGFIIGMAIGLIVGWNLLPQPLWVLRLYDRVSDRFIRWIQSWLLIIVFVSIAGCNSIPGVSQPEVTYPWKQRAMAEIALVSVTSTPSVAPDAKPVVGSKCPDCNDPPGDCPVGKTGDGTICNRCRKCNGDGRIDDQDLRSNGDTGESIVEAPKEITLHATSSQWKQWPTKWYSENRKPFEDRGWIVRVVLEPAGATETAYFDVQAPDGEVFNFFEPLTLAMIEHLETR
jgi:hypothetical protein